jgi:hypothetical protein
VRARTTPFFVLAVAGVLVGTGVVAFALVTGGTPVPVEADGWKSPVAVTPDSPSPSASSPSPAPSLSTSGEPIRASFPHSGPGTWRYSGTTGPVLGTAGTVWTFRLAVESNVSGVDLDQVAGKVDATLGDPRSWIAGGTVRFQRVAGGAPASFTIYCLVILLTLS